MHSRKLPKSTRRWAFPTSLECLADIVGDSGSQHDAARLYGAADAIRRRIGVVRCMIHEVGYQASVAALRDVLGQKEFKSAWEEGAGLSTEEAIAYAQRGRGGRKRASSGWASLTPAELDVVRLVSEGLTNNEIATRLFISPRTGQAHFGDARLATSEPESSQIRVISDILMTRQLRL